MLEENKQKYFQIIPNNPRKVITCVSSLCIMFYESQNYQTFTTQAIIVQTDKNFKNNTSWPHVRTRVVTQSHLPNKSSEGDCLKKYQNIPIFVWVASHEYSNFLDSSPLCSISKTKYILLIIYENTRRLVLISSKSMVNELRKWILKIEILCGNMKKPDHFWN